MHKHFRTYRMVFVIAPTRNDYLPILSFYYIIHKCFFLNKISVGVCLLIFSFCLVHRTHTTINATSFFHSKRFSIISLLSLRLRCLVSFLCLFHLAHSLILLIFSFSILIVKIYIKLLIHYYS